MWWLSIAVNQDPVRVMNRILIFIIVSFVSATAFCETSLFVGPLLGATSYNPSDGSQTRDSQTSYGGEALFLLDHWVGGLSYSAYSLGQTGNSTLSVKQDNQDIEGEIKYRLLRDDLTPFVALGAGELVQTVTTQLFNTTESSQGSFFIKDVGIGVMGRFLTNFGVSISGSYYQYSNVNGFKYFITLGYFPLL